MLSLETAQPNRLATKVGEEIHARVVARVAGNKLRVSVPQIHSYLRKVHDDDIRSGTSRGTLWTSSLRRSSVSNSSESAFAYRAYARHHQERLTIWKPDLESLVTFEFLYCTSARLAENSESPMLAFVTNFHGRCHCAFQSRRISEVHRVDESKHRSTLPTTRYTVQRPVLKTYPAPIWPQNSEKNTRETPEAWQNMK